MNKIAWGVPIILIFTLLILYIYSGTDVPVTDASTLVSDEINLNSDFEEKSELPQENEVNTVKEPELVLTGQKLLGSAYYRNLLFSGKGGTVYMEGMVYDSYSLEGISDIPVAIYCNDKLISDSIQTDSEGNFQLTSEQVCSLGSTSWVQTTYNDRSYQSYKFPVRKLKFSSGKRTSGNVGTYSGVPEFSTSSLAILVVAGSLGLILIRRNGW